MKKIVLITGATGGLGPDLLRGLALGLEEREVWLLEHRTLLHHPRAPLRPVAGDICQADLGLPASVARELRDRVQVIVHAAADTRSASSLASTRLTNVGGTNQVLSFARRCRRLERVVHLSATCAAGNQRGALWEAPWREIPLFVNNYQQSKWEAEQFVEEAGLPAEILRLAEVAGSQRTGAVRRLGSLHQFLFWIYKGFLPIIPASPLSRCDFISSDFVGLTLGHLLQSPVQPGRIVHLSQGERAPAIAEVLEAVAEGFEQHYPEWRHGRRRPPEIVDEQTYRCYQASVVQSRHPLFCRIMESGSYFLPSMLDPKVMRTDQLQRLLADEIPGQSWRLLLRQVIGYLARTNWGLDPLPATAPALS